MIAALAGCGGLAKSVAGPVGTIVLKSLPTSIQEGATLDVTATARASTGQPVAAAPLQAFVDGRAWGAPEATNAQGQAVLPLPLPSTGDQRIQVATRPHATDWIWGAGQSPLGPRYFVIRFHLNTRLLGSGAALLAETATLDIACDRGFYAYLNGHAVANAGDVQAPGVQRVTGLAPDLQAGTNVLAVTAWSGAHSGLAARLTISTLHGSQSVRTDDRWMVFRTPPTAWPEPDAAVHGDPVRVIAPAGGGPWMTRTGVAGSGLGLQPLFVGQRLPKGWVASPPTTIRVTPRSLTAAAAPRDLVGIEYETWFTPLNMQWQSAEAVPLLGRYQSSDALVTQQQALWLDRAGVNFILIDWTNNLWGKTSWSQRSANIRQLVDGTTALLNTYARMRSEGLPTPQVALLLGLNNGVSTTTTALSEEMTWIEDQYVRNPRYQGLWVHYLGKPLIVIFNGAGPAAAAGQPPIPTSQFTVRWMASQLQSNGLQRAGYWSWMDGSVHPVLTTYRGQPEALTVTPAFFGAGGWTGPQAMGRLGGTTYLREFAEALRDHPRFLLINQFNEFAGEPPSATVHVDTYTESLSDDIEPTSLTDCGYVSCGGWGFYYLNLTRALIGLYRHPNPQSTVLAVGSPLQGSAVCGNTLGVDWTALGAKPKGYEVRVDGRTVARNLLHSPYTLSLAHLRPGAHVLTVVATGAATRYPLSRTSFGPLMSRSVPVRVSHSFTYARTCPQGAASS